MKINWGAVGVGITVSGIVFSLAIWFTTVNFRLDNLESRMESVETEIREIRALIIERLPVK